MGLISFCSAPWKRGLKQGWPLLALLALPMLANHAGAQAAQPLSNDYLTFNIDTTGNFTLYANPKTNPTEVPLNTAKSALNYLLNPAGSHLYFQVDGGGLGSGFDYKVGDAASGSWLAVPTLYGNKLTASWQTSSITSTTTGGGGTGGTGGGGTGGGGTGGGGTGGTTTSTYNPQIEIDIVATLVHDTVRFEFDIKNNSSGGSHTVGLAFVQDIDVSPTGGGIVAANGPDTPLRLPTGSFLTTEAALIGSQVPPYFETLDASTAVPVTSTSSNRVTQVHSIRGTLLPTATSGSEPTTPTRLLYGLTSKLNATTTATSITVTAPDYGGVWQFQPDTTQIFTSSKNGSFPNAAVAVVWDPQPIQAASTHPFITYTGQSRSDYDLGVPTAMTVTAPTTLPVTRTASPTDPTRGVLVYNIPYLPDPSDTTGQTPQKDANGVIIQPFDITVALDNESDLLNTSGFTNGPFAVTLTLPTGLSLVPTTLSGFSGNTETQSIASISAGTEGTITYHVYPNGKAAGTEVFSVKAASQGFGPGKFVQRSIILPAPLNPPIIGANIAKGVYQMLTIPLQTGAASPSDVLYPGHPSDFKPPFVARYNSLTLNYENVTQLQPGYAYWFLSSLTSDQLTNPSSFYSKPLDVTKYPPLDITQNTVTTNVAYQRGWQQVGNPYLYSIHASDILVFDPTIGVPITIQQATAATTGILRPYFFHWNTTDPDSSQWHYDTYSDLGFDMQPFDGYWFYFLKDNIKLIFHGVNNPDAALTKLARYRPTKRVMRTTASNWRLRIEARSKNGYDPTTVIGVSSQATDDFDAYKSSKPPNINRSVSLDILHTTWNEGKAYALDVRSASASHKAWDMLVTSAQANEEVTLSWAGIATSVPRNYRLTLVDQDSNAQLNMRNLSSYTVNTGKGATRHIQVVAEPNSNLGGVRITNLALVSDSHRAVGGVEQSVGVSYSLSQDADVQVMVRDSRGRVVRALPVSRAVGSNSGQATWDLRNQQGGAIPVGLYSVELIATTQDGQRARQIVPYVRTR